MSPASSRTFQMCPAQLMGSHSFPANDLTSTVGTLWVWFDWHYDSAAAQDEVLHLISSSFSPMATGDTDLFQDTHRSSEAIYGAQEQGIGISDLILFFHCLSNDIRSNRPTLHLLVSQECSKVPYTEPPSSLLLISD